MNANNEKSSRYVAWFLIAAVRPGFSLFDFAAVMPDDATCWSDGRHVNAAGALLKPQLFAEFLRDRGMLP